MKCKDCKYDNENYMYTCFNCMRIGNAEWEVNTEEPQEEKEDKEEE